MNWKTVHSFTPFTFTLRSSILQFEWLFPLSAYQLPDVDSGSCFQRLGIVRRIPGEKNLLWVGGFPVVPAVGRLAGEGRGSPGVRFGPDYYGDIAKTIRISLRG